MLTSRKCWGIFEIIGNFYSDSAHLQQSSRTFSRLADTKRRTTRKTPIKTTDNNNTTTTTTTTIMSVREVNTSQFNQEIRGSKLVVVDMFAEWYVRLIIRLLTCNQHFYSNVSHLVWARTNCTRHHFFTHNIFPSSSTDKQLTRVFSDWTNNEQQINLKM